MATGPGVKGPLNENKGEYPASWVMPPVDWEPEPKLDGLSEDEKLLLRRRIAARKVLGGDDGA